MTRKTPLLCAVLLAAMAASPAAAEPVDLHLQDEALNTALDTLSLSNGDRKEAKTIIQEFRDDRHRAVKAMRSMGETLPPHEEVAASRAYSEAHLEDRLADLLSEGQLNTLINNLQEQRESQSRQSANH